MTPDAGRTVAVSAAALTEVLERHFYTDHQGDGKDACPHCHAPIRHTTTVYRYADGTEDEQWDAAKWDAKGDSSCEVAVPTVHAPDCPVTLLMAALAREAS